MLAKRIIPCLDVKDGKVVKGIQFKDHRVVGDILTLAAYYVDSGADELVFYDITASADQRSVNRDWVRQIAHLLDIPFCVAGGIRNLSEAESILKAGADKISINSPALENPNLIDQMVKVFGQQCVVVGVDSFWVDNTYKVYQYTGDATKTIQTTRLTEQWVTEIQARGAGEIVLNCMNQDGMCQGYDLAQLIKMRPMIKVPLIASGGAGSMQDFQAVFQEAKVDAALAASVFHTQKINILDLKKFLNEQQIPIRL